MTATDDVELDLLEQCRSGDRTAFRALVAFWGDPALQLAMTLTGEESRARAALADAFATCWRDLASVHSGTPFRPHLLNLVARAALTYGTAGGTGSLERCLDMLDQDARVSVVLNGQANLQPRDIAHAQDTPTAATMLQLRTAMRSFQSCLGSKPFDALRAAWKDVHLERAFFDDVLSAKLGDPFVIEVRRIVQRSPQDSWGVLTDPTAIPAWVSADHAHVRGGGSLRPGGHIAARGRIADQRRSLDESIITMVEPPSLLAWTTRSRIQPVHDPIEFRWSISIAEVEGGSELHHRLRGVAFPRGFPGRYLRGAYERVADGMQSSMHRGLERLAALVEATAR
ncbi:MAG TPA: SRPBCC family protein [Actinomycetota bacterium]|nr:SRPBCC family protein [Actinomycetota bacterium]